MRIAVPMVEQRFSSHFGGSDAFAVYDLDDDCQLVLAREDMAAPAHEHGSLPRFLVEQKVDVVLTGGMGGGAQAIFADHGVRIVTGLSGDAPDALIAGWIAGTVLPGENACGGGHHGHDGGSCGNH
jgi:predicted Fe-Mo cluster-binding NifX family protein